MQTNDLTPEKLRELADLKPDNARVLSLFLNLAPTEFASPAARGAEVRSLIDQANRLVKDEDGIGHDELMALRDDVERADKYFNNGDFDAKGAHGLAVYLAGPADLFEIVKLPRPVQTNVVVDDAALCENDKLARPVKSNVVVAISPYIEPIAVLGSRARWGVLLVSRKN